MNFGRVFFDEVYVYEVTYTSLDDGHRLSAGYYSNVEAANAEIDRLREASQQTDPKVLTWTAYEQDGEYHFMKEIDVQHVSKNQVLARLSKEERKVLGYKE